MPEWLEVGQIERTLGSWFFTCQKQTLLAQAIRAMGTNDKMERLEQAVGSKRQHRADFSGRCLRDGRGRAHVERYSLHITLQSVDSGPFLVRLTTNGLLGRTIQSHLL